MMTNVAPKYFYIYLMLGFYYFAVGVVFLFFQIGKVMFKLSVGYMKNMNKKIDAEIKASRKKESNRKKK